MSWPPTHVELFRYGIPSRACAPDAQQIDSISVAANLVELRGHGFGGGELVRIVTKNGTIPAAIASTLTWYTVAPTTDQDTFGLVGVTFADPGSGQLSVVEDITPKLDDAMAVRASWLESWYKSRRAPWLGPPGWGPMIVAHLVAFDVAKQLRIPEARYPVELVKQAYEDAQAFLKLAQQGEEFDDGVGPVESNPKNPMGSVAVRLKGRGFLRGDREDVV